jgi:uncharacterized protein YegP (UPF0339 family)
MSENENQNDASDVDGRNSEFELYEDSGGEWRWRLVAANGNIIADSGEGYTSEYAARNAAVSLKKEASSASVVVPSSADDRDADNAEDG